MSMPTPDGFPKLATAPTHLMEEKSGEDDGRLTSNESGFILDACLKPKDRRNESLLVFIENFVRCKNIAESSDAAGIKYSLGYSYRHRADVANAIQKLIDKSVLKYGFDASEIMERTKEIVDFDPISVQNADGTFKDNFHDIDPAARRNIKKLKVQNLYSNTEDMNGMKKKIIVGKIIEYEFYDKLKAVDLAGKEKEMFKTTTRVEHDVTKNMASILLASAQKGAQASLAYAPKTVEVQSHTIKESEDERD